MQIKFIPTTRHQDLVMGKIADVEIHFGIDQFGAAKDGEPLKGLKLIGFAIWERPSGKGRNVTFPARQYSINGERRAFALLRPLLDNTASDALRDRILNAYREYEESRAQQEATS